MSRVDLNRDPKHRHVVSLTFSFSLSPHSQVLRSYLEPHELPYFDARVIPAKTAALVAIHGLQGQAGRQAAIQSEGHGSGSVQRTSETDDMT